MWFQLGSTPGGPKLTQPMVALTKLG